MEQFLLKEIFSSVANEIDITIMIFFLSVLVTVTVIIYQGGKK